jgi:hypothetical protein
MNHYLFLDLDGVCNSHRYFFGGESMGDRERNIFNMIDPSTIPHLNAICDPLGVKVVITSSARLAYPMGQFKRAFRDHGLNAPIIGKTGYSAVGDSTNRRGIEIGNWLHAEKNLRYEPRRFLILDDSADMGPLLPYLVRTTWGEGLLAEHVEPALKILRGE